MSSSSTNYEVRKIVGKAPWNVLYCHSCIPPALPNVADIKPHDEFSWALNLRCFKCNSKWIICTICSNTRTGMTTKTQLYLHNHKKHNNHIEKPSKIQPLSSESHFDVDYESQDNFQSLDISLPVGSVD